MEQITLTREQIRQVNDQCNVKLLLKTIGVDVEGNPTCHCPFHPDGKKSAKYYEDGNSIYCFAESKQYKAYDILRFIGFKDEDIISRVDFTRLPKPKEARGPRTIFTDKSKASSLRARFMERKISVADFTVKIFELISGTVPDA